MAITMLQETLIPSYFLEADGKLQNAPIVFPAIVAQFAGKYQAPPDTGCKIRSPWAATPNLGYRP